MSSDRTWQEVAASNRERITALEHELGRVRDRQHELAEQVAVTLYLANQVRDLADDVKQLASDMRTFSRRAVERPTSAGWSAIAGWVGALVAFALLVKTFVG